MTSGGDMTAELTRRLAAGESPDVIFRSLVPEPWRPVLHACAAARIFDLRMYEEVLRNSGEAPDSQLPDLTELLERQIVVPARGEPDSYTLPPGDRSAYFRHWTDSSQPSRYAQLLLLEQRIAAYLAAEGDRTEELRHLLLATPETALARFDEMFSEADDRRDFAACTDLIDVLEDPDRFGHLSPELRERLQDRAGYVRARSYWAADYARAAQFLPPTSLIRDAERFLEGRRRVWHLYAPGGAGKTMQLRWLVTRHWVPSARDVLCARVDFDYTSARAVGRHPWLVLLEIADQFERRLPGRPFERLEGYAAYRVLLDRRPSRLAREAAQNITSLDSGAVEEELLAVFADRLNRARPAAPVVLVVDTVEELVLHGRAEAEQVMRLLGRLVDLCPGLRLILAGRCDLRTDLPESFAGFGRNRVKHTQVRPFSEEQARAYLVEKRRIDDPELVRAAISKANGLPFTLALCADVIDSDPTLTPDALALREEPHLRYLIERVLDRITDPTVRWLLRYGVIPRQLRADDVKGVMAPWLTEGISGTGRDDDPLKDVPHLRGRSDIFPTSPEPLTPQALDNAWRRLLDYAGAASWVSRQAGDDSVVVFHVNVVAPMRQLVSRQPVASRLHHAFAERFEQLAGADPDQRIGYIKEAIYHRFQARDPRAEQTWRQAVRDADEAHDLDGMRQLGEEVLGEEYLHEGTPRLHLDGGLFVSHSVVIAAHLTIATALALKQAEETTYNPADPLWNEVEHRLALVDDLRVAAPLPVTVDSAEHILRAGVLASCGKGEEAEALIRRALADEGEARWRERLQVTLARIQSSRNDVTAEATYRIALHIARSRKADTSHLLISLELAQRLERDGRLSQAFELQDAVINPGASSSAIRARSGTSVESAAASLRARARVAKARGQLRSFLPTEALATLKFLQSPTDTSHRLEACLLSSRAYRQLGRSTEALATLDEADGLATAGVGPSRHRFLARSVMARAAIEGELLAVDRAQAHFDHAAGLWSDLGFPQGHPQCLLLYARFLARDLGDLRRAAAALGQLKVADGAGAWAVQSALMWNELLCQGYSPPDSALLEVPVTSQESLLRGGAAIVIAAPHRAAEVVQALRSVQPPSARLLALDGLTAYPSGSASAFPPDELAQMQSLFASTVRPGPDSPDRHVQLQLVAEFERVCGGKDRALALSERAYPAPHLPTAPNDPLHLWRRARAEMRFTGEADARTGQHLLAVAGDDVPLLTAAARWIFCQHAPGHAREEALRRAAEELSRVHQESVWEAHVLNAVGQVLEEPPDGSFPYEPALPAAVNRMFARLGYAEPLHAPIRIVQNLAQSLDERVMALSPEPGSHPGGDLVALANELLHDWRAATQRVIPGMTVLSEGRAPSVSVQVQSDDVSLHAFPWEFSLLTEGADEDVVLYRNLPDAAESADVRALQAALRRKQDMEIVADGLLGGITAAALVTALDTTLSRKMGSTSRALLSLGLSTAALSLLWSLLRENKTRTQGQHGSRTVLVLDSGPSHSSRSEDPWTARQPLSEIYETQGCEPMQLFSSAALPPPRKGPPALLHVHAPLKLKSGSTPYFDLSPTGLSHSDRLDSKVSGSDLDASRLVQWLAGFDPGTQPLIVLDPPRPSSPADIPLQLVLRNHFAAALFASGLTPAVIGAGLVRASDLQTMVLGTALVEGASLLELLKTLRAVALLREKQGRDLGKRTDMEWGDDILEAVSASMFATPSALRVSES
ncbi:hypothetical protein ACIRIR_27965 [Streptomyces globisporus]|uniref:hypothetical protein n=1 Tax=Streptomyces globisporus TaxID=1908 RepID=UPI0038188E26